MCAVVATRYKGVIHNYEIWNEPNVKGTFTGSPQAMLELSRAAYRILKSVDPTITVVSPAATADDGVSWLGEYLQKGGCAYADVIGYHFYVTPEPPEAMIPLIKKVDATIRRHDCENKPLWNTESGWAEPEAIFVGRGSRRLHDANLPAELASRRAALLLVRVGQPQLEHARSDLAFRQPDDQRRRSLWRHSQLDAWSRSPLVRT